jgi:hypothetical protein
MKLLFCLECQDIVRLSPERRSCRCGRAWGQYLEDHQTTVQTRNSLSIALAGPDFDRAIRSLIDQSGTFSPLLFIRAWFNPLSEKDVRYVETEGADEGADETEIKDRAAGDA